MLAELADADATRRRAASATASRAPRPPTSHSRWPGGRSEVADPPEWFGVIKPSRLLAPSAGPGAQATDKELRLEFDPIDLPEADDDDGDREQSGESKILKLFENPLFNSQALSDYFRKLLGSSRSPGDSAAGAEMQVRSVRRVHAVGANARPLPTPIHFTDDGKPGAAVGVGGALYPEWDVHNNRYRPEWCRVIDFPLTAAADVSAAGVPHDDVLRRRLSRIGLGPKVLRGRPDGDELDIEALIDLFVDLRSGYSPPEHVYLERRKLARNLGVLILLDASGSATDTDPDGLAVHDHQRRAAATLAVTLEELGDRVAVYAFRSQGRHAVHLPAIKAVRTTFRRRRASPAQPAPAVGLHAPRRRNPRRGRNPQDRGRHTESAAGRPLGRFPLRRRLRRPLRRSRRPQGPRRAPRGRRCLPVPFHRRRHCHRCARTRLRLRQLCQRRDPGRLEPADG